MKKTILLAALLLALASAPAAAADEWVRVTVDNANVRLRAGMDAEIVLKAAKGDEFEVIGMSGPWFKIIIPAETGAEVEEGYLHETVAERVRANTPAPSEKAAAPVRPAPRARRPQPAVPAKLFSGFSAKFGFMTSPAASFGDRWLLALALDRGLNPFLAAGLEFQPYFRSFSDAGFSSSALGANLFLNAKGGVNLGRFAEKLKFLTPYAGGGLGGAFAYSSSKFGNETASDFEFNFAWHIMFGFEVVLKKMSAILEFQIIKVSLKDITPDPTQYFWMLGVRF